MNRALRDRLKRAAFVGYKQALRLGVHIIPTHYYTPLPNLHELERTKERWIKPSSMTGIEVDLDAQMANLTRVCAPFAHEVAGNPHYRHAIKQPFPTGRSRFFGPIEAQVLHCAIRYYQPDRVIEIGGGVPSYCSCQAVARNGDDAPITYAPITCIEPNPVDMIKSLDRQFSNFELVNMPIQDVPRDIFTSLQPNDIVSIDTNHGVKAGGEVNFIVLEILPILPPGVLVQMHDNYLPYDYERDILDTFLPENETSLVQAFLTFNHRYKILFALSMLHYSRQREMQKVLPEYNPETNFHGLRVEPQTPDKHFPSSLWLQVQ